MRNFDRSRQAVLALAVKTLKALEEHDVEGEPRDEDGKWTSSGASPAGGMPAKELPASSQEKLKDTKVVDEKGEPKEVYHGSPYGELDSFDPSKSPDHYPGIKQDDTDGNYSEGTTWFTDSKEVAHGYAAGGYRQKSDKLGEWDSSKSIRVKVAPLPRGTVIQAWPGKGARPVTLTEEDIKNNKRPKGIKKTAQLQVRLPNGITIFNPNDDYSTPKAALKSATDSYNAPIPQRTSSHVHSAFLALKNPLIVDFEGKLFRNTGGIADRARREGHDGVIFKNVIDPGLTADRAEPTTTYAVFNSDHIIKNDK